MPAKINIHLMFPSTQAHRVVKAKVALGDRFRSDRDQIDVLLRPDMAWNGGRDVWVDAERGIEVNYGFQKKTTRMLPIKDQTGEIIGYRSPESTIKQQFEGDKIKGLSGEVIEYPGLPRWVGVDGRYTYAAQIQKDARDLQTRGIAWDKYVWPFIIFVLGIMGALVAALAFSVEKKGG